MVDISLISRLVLGVQRNIDISQNTLIVGSLKVGTSTPVELTKTILTNLIALQDGSDFATGTNAHTHDGRYFTETELGAVTGTTGSDLIGDDNTYTNFTPTTTTVKGALAGIDAALSSGDGKVKVTAADTTSSYLNAALTAGAGLSQTVTNPAADETLTLSVNVDDSSIEINANTLRVKAAGITSAMLAGSIDATKIADGSVTSTEFQYINSLTSNAQDQIDSKVAKAGDTMSGNLAMGGNKVTGLGAPSANGDALRYDQLGANNGIATLDGGGKIPVSQLPNSVMEYLGTWAASTNTPTLANGTGNAGDVYVASDAGTVNFGAGNITFAAGDWVVYSGSLWQKSINSNAVASVNGQTGIVTVNAINQLTGDVTASAATQSESKATTVAAIQGTTVSGTTGTGNVVFSASPTLTGTLSAATITASGAVTGSNLSGTNTGDQTITLTGDVTGSGTGSFATTIASGAVTASKLATVTDGVTLDQGGAGSTLQIKALGVDTAQLAASAVTAAKIATSAVDGTTITGGAGTALSVASSPKTAQAGVAGESFAADTSFFVRYAISGETAGRAYKADQDTTSSDKFYAYGVTLNASAVSAAGAISVLTMGLHTLGASDAAFSSGDIGKPVYLTAAGAFSTTVPSASLAAVYRVGVVATTTTMWVGNMQINGVNA